MKTIVYIFLLAILMSGCKKYPDDNKRYLFKSPLKRITTHGWKVQELLINDKDSTERVYTGYVSTNPVDYAFKDVIIHFKKSSYPKDFSLSAYRMATALPLGIAGSQSAGWNFADDKDRLIFFLDSGPTYTNSFQLNTKVQYWDIRELTEDKLVIETIENIRKIRLTFKPLGS